MVAHKLCTKTCLEVLLGRAWAHSCCSTLSQPGPVTGDHVIGRVFIFKAMPGIAPQPNHLIAM